MTDLYDNWENSRKEYVAIWETYPEEGWQDSAGKEWHSDVDLEVSELEHFEVISAASDASAIEILNRDYVPSSGNDFIEVETDNGTERWPCRFAFIGLFRRDIVEKVREYHLVEGSE